MKLLFKLAASAAMIVCLLGLTASAQTSPAAGGAPSVREVLPATADPSLKTEFDAPNVIIVPSGKLRPELVVFFPGTHGKPKQNTEFLETIASGHFRVIGLMYNNVPHGYGACGKTGDVNCEGSFRRARVEGDAPDAIIKNTPQESIMQRLANLLKYLDKTYPGEGWRDYLAGELPNWQKIIVTGHSQGAGMAAYVAKFHEVARAVLFSGPTDGINLESDSRKLAAWLYEPGKTPSDRWYAEFHEKEKIAPLQPMILDALKVPKDHVFVFKLDPPSTVKAPGLVAYHMTVVHDPSYQPEWEKMFGFEKTTK